MAAEWYELRFYREGEEQDRVRPTQARLDLQDDAVDGYLDRHLIAANARNRDDAKNAHLWSVEVRRYDRATKAAFGAVEYRRALPVEEGTVEPRAPQGRRW